MFSPKPVFSLESDPNPPKEASDESPTGVTERTGIGEGSNTAVPDDKCMAKSEKRPDEISNPNKPSDGSIAIEGLDEADGKGSITEEVSDEASCKGSIPKESSDEAQDKKPGTCTDKGSGDTTNKGHNTETTASDKCSSDKSESSSDNIASSESNKDSMPSDDTDSQLPGNKTDQDLLYKISKSERHGMGVVIICDTFKPENGEGKDQFLAGGEADEKNLKDLFNNFGLQVVDPKINPKYDEIDDFLDNEGIDLHVYMFFEDNRPIYV